MDVEYRYKAKYFRNCIRPGSYFEMATGYMLFDKSLFCNTTRIRVRRINYIYIEMCTQVRLIDVVRCTYIHLSSNWKHQIQVELLNASDQVMIQLEQSEFQDSVQTTCYLFTYIQNAKCIMFIRTLNELKKIFFQIKLLEMTENFNNYYSLDIPFYCLLSYSSCAPSYTYSLLINAHALQLTAN